MSAGAQEMMYVLEQTGKVAQTEVGPYVKDKVKDTYSEDKEKEKGNCDWTDVYVPCMWLDLVSQARVQVVPTLLLVTWLILDWTSLMTMEAPVMSPFHHTIECVHDIRAIIFWVGYSDVLSLQPRQAFEVASAQNDCQSDGGGSIEM